MHAFSKLSGVSAERHLLISICSDKNHRGYLDIARSSLRPPYV